MPKKGSHDALPLTPSRRLNKMAAKPLTGTSSNHKLLKSINTICIFWCAIIVIKIAQMAKETRYFSIKYIGSTTF